MRIPLVLLVSLAAAATSTACAPRMAKTHFARWSEQDQQRRDENAAEEKVDAWLRAQAGVAASGDAKAADKAPGSTPKTATSVQSHSATATHDTPAIGATKTSTRSSRVVKPAENKEEQEDEAIY